MLLADLLRTEYLPSRIELSRGYVEALEITVRKFSLFLGHPARLPDLTERTIASFLVDYRSRWSPRSTNNQRAHLITLWNAAVDASLLDRVPVTRRIRKLKTRPEPPKAWTVEQIAKLMRYADSLRGGMCDVPRSLWWGALFSMVYWTGCRIRAATTTESCCYEAGAGVLVKNQKNKTPQWYPLPHACCERIDATEPAKRKLLFPYDHHPKQIFSDARKIIEAAGLDCPRGKGMQLFHRLRRTTLTYCAMVDPAIAQRQAGHSSYATTLRSYVDPRILGAPSAADVLPDPLAEPPIYSSHKFHIYG